MQAFYWLLGHHRCEVQVLEVTKMCSCVTGTLSHRDGFLNACVTKENYAGLTKPTQMCFTL